MRVSSLKHYKKLLKYNMADDIRKTEVYNNKELCFECYGKTVSIFTESCGTDEFDKKVSELAAEGIIQRLGLYDLAPKESVYKSLCGTYIYEKVEKDLRDYFMDNVAHKELSITICTLNEVLIRVYKNNNLIIMCVSVNDKRSALLSLDFEYYLNKVKNGESYSIGKNLISAVQSVKPQIFAVEKRESVCG